MTLYTNTTKYEAVQMTTDEAVEKALSWIAPLVTEEEFETVDLNGFRDDAMWAIKHPSGQVAFVPANDFLMTFTEVPGTEDDADPMAAFEAKLSE